MITTRKKLKTEKVRVPPCRHKLPTARDGMRIYFYPLHAIAMARVMPSYAVRLSVRLSVRRNADVRWSYNSGYKDSCYMNNYISIFTLSTPNISYLVQGSALKFWVE